MAGGKETPRQKMIGMMYLVLTALLAMNVSKEVLNAFVVVNEGLMVTNENFGKKVEQSFKEFEAAKNKDAKKVTPYFDRAQKAKAMAEELVKHIDELKSHIIMETDKKPKEAADTLAKKLIWVDSKDNYDIPTHILIGDEPATPKPASEKFSALELKEKITKLREEMINVFKDEKLFLPAVTKNMEEKLNSGLALNDGVENGVKAPWEIVNFFHLPLAAVITNLSKIQTDINNAQAEIIATLLQAVKGKDFTFDKLVAKVIAPSSYILAGDEYQADILLVAFNSTTNPEVLVGNVDTVKKTLIGDGTKLPIEGGMGKYTVSTSAEGLQKFGGVIKVEKPGGGFEAYPFMSEYMVAKPAISVSPTKMNVFYIGVPNPIEVAAAGVAPENLVVSGGNCSLSGAKGKYEVKVNAGTEATISVSAKDKDGKARPMGAPAKFRIKRIPDPVAVFGGKKGDDVISKAELNAASGVIAKLENFDFDLKFDVKSFEVTTFIKGQLVNEKVEGPAVSSKIKSYFSSLSPGQKLWIEQVKAVGPDGTVRKIPGVNLKVK